MVISVLRSLILTAKLLNGPIFFSFFFGAGKFIIIC